MYGKKEKVYRGRSGKARKLERQLFGHELSDASDEGENANEDQRMLCRIEKFQRKHDHFGEKSRAIMDQPTPISASIKVTAAALAAEIKRKLVGRKPLWVDDDDVMEADLPNLHKWNLGAKAREAKFRAVYGNHDWMTTIKPKPEDSVLKVLPARAHKNLTMRNLPNCDLQIIRLFDLNGINMEPQLIRSIDFHPTEPYGMVIGTNKNINLYRVDGVQNPALQKSHMKNVNAVQSCFSASGKEIYGVTGRDNTFVIYDIQSTTVTQVVAIRTGAAETFKRIIPCPSGKILITLGLKGQIYIHDTISKDVVATLYVNGEINDIAFDSTGTVVYGVSNVGELYRWDLRKRNAVGKLTDEGAMNTTRVAVSQRHVACGSMTGIVNLYDEAELNHSMAASRSNRKTHAVPPIKTFKNLTTCISDLSFNHNGEILAMGSIATTNGIRLANMHTLNVFQNFPEINRNYNRVNCIAFTPHSGYMSVGDNLGTAYLLRLHHYDMY